MLESATSISLISVLAEIGADPSLQEIWLSACYPLHTQLVAPRDDLRTQIKLNIAHIVEQNYPHLVNRGMLSFNYNYKR